MKTGWQKALKVVSILLLIDAVLAIVLAVVTLAGAAAMPGVAAQTGVASGDAAQVVMTFQVAAVLAIIGGLFDLFCGVFGLKAAGNTAKAKPAVALGIIAVIFAAANLILAFNMQYALGCVLPVLYLVSALQVKRGK